MVGKWESLLAFAGFSRTLSVGVLQGQVWLIFGLFTILYLWEMVSVFSGKYNLRKVWKGGRTGFTEVREWNEVLFHVSAYFLVLKPTKDMNVFLPTPLFFSFNMRLGSDKSHLLPWFHLPFVHILMNIISNVDLFSEVSLISVCPHDASTLVFTGASNITRPKYSVSQGGIHPHCGFLQSKLARPPRPMCFGGVPKSSQVHVCVFCTSRINTRQPSWLYLFHSWHQK